LPDDERWDHIDLTPEAQKRFNRVYGALKHHQALGEQLLQDNVLLAERLERLEHKVTAGQEATTEGQLKAAKAAALSAQDYSRVVEIDDALLDLKTRALQPSPAVSPTIATAPEHYQLDETSRAVLDDWSRELGADGSPLRPWVNSNHPLHEKANRAHGLVMADPMTAFADISIVLDAIDRYMGVDKRPTAAAPTAAARPAKHAAFMAGDNPPKSKSPQPQLTAQQIHVAKRMFRGSPDAVERYRKALGQHG
jgi:hypothetical protein